ncbi:hypothetical protein HK098_005275 [Nowakowskiella sp. JEL0407]|nr:hypothetical protein HK098_005275 [Nowakowskiella sp. JEL0407]
MSNIMCRLSSKLDIPFELMILIWRISSKRKYYEALRGLTANFEHNVVRFSSLPPVDEFENSEYSFLLAINIAHVLRTSTLNDDAEAINIIVGSDFLARFLTEFFETPVHRVYASFFSPILHYDTQPYLFCTEILLKKMPIYAKICNANNRTPLFLAIRYRNTDLIRGLLESDHSDFPAVSDSVVSVLHEACKQRDLGALKHLISKLPKDRKHSISELHLLAVCVESYSVEVVEYLLSGVSGLDMDFTDFYSLLELAVGCDSHKVAMILISSCPSAIFDLRNSMKVVQLLHLCINSNSPNFANTLLMFELPSMVINYPISEGKTLLHLACLQNIKSSMVSLLLNHGADPRIVGKQGKTALHHLATNFTKCLKDNDSIVRLTSLYPGAMHELDENGMTPLAIAVIHGNCPAVDYLLQVGSDPNKVPPTRQYPPARIRPVSANRIYRRERVLCTLRSLLEYGLDPNRTFTDGVGEEQTLLHVACCEGDLERVRYLLAYGANPYALNSVGETVLSVLQSTTSHAFRITVDVVDGIPFPEAEKVWNMTKSRISDTKVRPMPLYGDYTEAINTYRRNSNVNLITHPDRNGNSLLHKFFNDQELSDYLISRGADVNSQNKKGDTVLHAAVRLGEISPILSILANIPNLTLRNNEGMDAHDLAMKLGLDPLDPLASALKGDFVDWANEKKEDLPWNELEILARMLFN